MALGQPFFDLVLPFDQPVHGRVKLVFMGVRNAKILRQRCIGPAMRHGQFAGFRHDDAARHHRRETRSRSREALPSISLSNSSRRIAMRTASTCPCGSERMQSRTPSAGAQLLALENEPDGLRLLQRQGRQVGDGPLPDALAFPDALAQQDGRFGASIGHKVDVHAAQII